MKLKDRLNATIMATEFSIQREASNKVRKKNKNRQLNRRLTLQLHKRGLSYSAHRADCGASTSSYLRVTLGYLRNGTPLIRVSPKIKRVCPSFVLSGIRKRLNSGSVAHHASINSFPWVPNYSAPEIPSRGNSDWRVERLCNRLCSFPIGNFPLWDGRRPTWEIIAGTA